jgi:DNA-binding CsgD family transcriptional regulator
MNKPGNIRQYLIKLYCLIKNLIMKTSNVNLLTPREKEVLEELAQNTAATRTIKAERLEISESTFNNHLRNIFRKLGVNREICAIKKFLDNKLCNNCPYKSFV